MPDDLDYIIRKLTDLATRVDALEGIDPLLATGYPGLAGLTTGQPLRATGAAAAAFGALDLANASAVTGALLIGKGGTGLAGTPSNGQLPIGNGAGYTLAALTGTANQVTVTNGAGSITLSAPQNLGTGSSPTFANIFGNTYTPTLTNVANLDGSSAFVCQYMRVGDEVTVSGKVTMDPTTNTTATRLGITLPIASNFSATEQCSGVGYCTGVANLGLAVEADATNDRAQLTFITSTTANNTFHFTFTYRII